MLRMSADTRMRSFSLQWSPIQGLPSATRRRYPGQLKAVPTGTPSRYVTLLSASIRSSSSIAGTSGTGSSACSRRRSPPCTPIGRLVWSASRLTRHSSFRLAGCRTCFFLLSHNLSRQGSSNPVSYRKRCERSTSPWTREKLEELGMTVKEFAIRTSKPEKTINAILRGSSSITMDMAVAFESVTGIPARF